MNWGWGTHNPSVHKTNYSKKAVIDERLKSFRYIAQSPAASGVKDEIATEVALIPKVMIFIYTMLSIDKCPSLNFLNQTIAHSVQECLGTLPVFIAFASPCGDIAGMYLLFLSRGEIRFPPLESARTKNRPGTICVFNNTLSREHQPGGASPWLMG